MTLKLSVLAAMLVLTHPCSNNWGLYTAPLHAEEFSTPEKRKILTAQFLPFGAHSAEEAHAPPVAHSAAPASEEPTRNRIAKPQNQSQAKATANLTPRKPATAPLPPRRPPGDLTDTGETAPAQQSSDFHDANLAKAEPLTSDKTEAQKPADSQGSLQVSPAPPPETGDMIQRNILLLAAPGLENLKDLDGRKIATWRSDLSSEQFRAMLSLNAGLNLTAISEDFTSALQSLAQGEVDAVIIGVGPKLSDEDAEGLSLKPFHLLEIPVLTAKLTAK